MSLDFTAINPAAARAEDATSRQSGDLPTRAQFVVVGGGVVGTSIAYHLALLGASDVVLLERKQLTSGTTWHAAGEVVSGGTTEDALWMARYSAELYARLEEETGLSTGFRTCGYLQLATTERRVSFATSCSVEPTEMRDEPPAGRPCDHDARDRADR